MSSKGGTEQGGGLLSLASAAQSAEGTSLGAAPTGRVSSQMVVLAVVLVGAGGLLFGMRHLGLGPQVSLANLKLDYERADEPAAAKARYTKVMGELAKAAVPPQVKGEELGKNPFRLLKAEAPTETLASSDWQQQAAEDAAARQAEQERLAQEAANKALTGEIASLHLHSVLGGRVPLARINDETVTVGDTVAGRFSVVAIEGRSVTLQAEGRQFTLSVEDQRQPSFKAKAKAAGRRR